MEGKEPERKSVKAPNPLWFFSCRGDAVRRPQTCTCVLRLSFRAERGICFSHRDLGKSRRFAQHDTFGSDYAAM